MYICSCLLKFYYCFIYRTCRRHCRKSDDHFSLGETLEARWSEGPHRIENIHGRSVYWDKGTLDPVEEYCDRTYQSGDENENVKTGNSCAFEEEFNYIYGTHAGSRPAYTMHSVSATTMNTSKQQVTVIRSETTKNTSKQQVPVIRSETTNNTSKQQVPVIRSETTKNTSKQQVPVIRSGNTIWATICEVIFSMRYCSSTTQSKEKRAETTG